MSQQEYLQRNKLLEKHGYENYGVYLKSEHWKKIKDLAWDKKRRRECLACGAKKKLQLHHLSYENIHLVTLEDLIHLCEDCHEGVSEKSFKSNQSIRVVTYNFILKRRGFRKPEKKKKYLKKEKRRFGVFSKHSQSLWSRKQKAETESNKRRAEAQRLIK